MVILERPSAFQLLFSLRGSILPRIARSLATCAALAVIVSFSHGFLFRWKVTLTPVPFSLIGLALAIFLGFRNSTAYDRFWEARKLWGSLVHGSRTLARQLLSAVAPQDAEGVLDEDLPAVMIRRTIAFAHALRHELRDSDPAGEVAKWLSPGDLIGFRASRLGADYLLRRNASDLGILLRAGRVAPPMAAEMDKSLALLASVQAGCERIHTTPIPYAYSLLLHRTAYLYCFLLPFGLVDLIGFMTPFVVVIVAYTFFGLDALGDEIEQPFGTSEHHLPLEAICRTVEINLLEALGEEPLPEPLQPVDACLR